MGEVSSRSDSQRFGVTRVDLLKDNKSVLLSLQNGDIKLFNTLQGSVLNTYSGHAVISNQGQSAYFDVKANKDNSYFISGSGDGFLYM